MKLREWFQAIFKTKKKKKPPFLVSFQNRVSKIIGYTVLDPKLDLYVEAFTHTSLRKKNAEGHFINFERLEFVGDSIIGSVIAEYLFVNSKGKDEGYLTKNRSKIISRENLNKVGSDLKLKPLLFKARKAKSLNKDLEGDLYESLVGAIYMDKGFETAKKFIYQTILKNLNSLDELEKKITSHKSLMIEWGQKHKKKIVFSTKEEQNAQSQKIFVCNISIEGVQFSKGRATSKKKAEEIASKRAYYGLKTKNDFSSFI